MNDKERLEEIVKQVKRSDEYAEKGLWAASDKKIVNLHNEGHINYLIERVQELEEINRRIRQNKYHEAYEQGKFDTNMAVWYEKPKLEQQNSRYREAINKAMRQGVYIEDCNKRSEERRVGKEVRQGQG